MKDQKAFTIVELLLVIVVIGILASVSLVTFRGVQDRATASRVTGNLKSYVDAAKLYKVDNGYYPKTSTSMGIGTQVCLGNATDYPAVTGMLAGECSSDHLAVTSAVNTEFLKYMGSITNVSHPVVSYFTSQIRGPIYGTIDNGARAKFYVYLKGDQTCSMGTKTYVSDDNTTECMIELK